MSDIITGEAVVLDLRLARTASRGLAMAVDLLVQATALILVIPLLLASNIDSSLAAAVALSIMILILVGYPVVFETLSRGRSLGKMAFGLRVVRDDGGPIRFRHALVRGLAGFFVDFWALGLFGAVALLVSLFSANSKRVGDYLAGTVVVRQRVPRGLGGGLGSRGVEMPPHLAAWAGTLDLTLLPDDLALAVRQYLGRLGDLTPSAREALGSRLAAEISGYIRTPPPAGTPAVDYLAALLAERRAREEARLQPSPAAADPATAPTDPSPPPAGESPFAPPL
jgi:uncharacterized RDD family membrane protein YckC